VLFKFRVWGFAGAAAQQPPTWVRPCPSARLTSAPVHAVKAYWVVEVQLHWLLTSLLDGLGRFATGKRPPGIHWIGDWVGTRAWLDALENRKISCRSQKLNHDSSVVLLVPHYQYHYLVPVTILTARLGSTWPKIMLCMSLERSGLEDSDVLTVILMSFRQFILQFWKSSVTYSCLQSSEPWPNNLQSQLKVSLCLGPFPADISSEIKYTLECAIYILPVVTIITCLYLQKKGFVDF
jgi:hypothetical protein